MSGTTSNPEHSQNTATHESVDPQNEASSRSPARLIRTLEDTTREFFKAKTALLDLLQVICRERDEALDKMERIEVDLREMRSSVEVMERCQDEQTQKRLEMNQRLIDLEFRVTQMMTDAGVKHGSLIKELFEEVRAFK
ncbi:hypothetical protein V5O48_007243 [Marasmius crinis-equi]|uniref:Uncharacterized protein n=1 Tax=Marasmius crinis-equi TaxID=585013 RepID=A0ABR3FH77_9AGAR